MSNSPGNTKFQPEPNEPLFDEFKKVYREDWEKIIAGDLNGADYKEKLSWKTDEGFSVLPFYTRGDLDNWDFMHSNPGQFPFRRGYQAETHSCSYGQPLLNSDVEQVKNKITEAQESGIDSFYLPLQFNDVHNGLPQKMRGISLANQMDVNSLLSASLNNKTHFIIDADAATPIYAAAIANFLQQHKESSPALKVDLLYDPLNALLFKDDLYSDEKNWITNLEELILYTEELNLPFRVLGINAGQFHNAGANAAQELAFSMSIATEYIDALTEKEVSLDTIFSQFFISYSIGSSYFKEIAKLRAARILWAQLAQSFHGEEFEVPRTPIYTFTSLWNKTDYDPHTNMLRTTTETMSAAIGGSDVMVIHPFDYRFRQPDDFSERIARNQYLMLDEEAHFTKVDDPAGGSYYVEVLTNKLAESAWKLFQNIEREGGFYKSAQKGIIQSKIRESRNKQMGDLARRKKTMVGINDFPDPDDSALERAHEDDNMSDISSNNNSYKLNPNDFFSSIGQALQEGALLGDLLPELVTSNSSSIETLSTGNIADSFRRLRLQTEQFKEKNNYRPTVFTMPLGNPKWGSARATFSTNFFGVAGYSIHEHIPFESVDEAVEKLKETDAEITILCSSDKEYPDLVPKVAERLRQKSIPTTLVLAGNPGDKEDLYRSHGIRYFIYKGINVLHLLEKMHKELGITE